MITWLHHLPDMAIFAMLTLPLVLAMVAAPLVLNTLFPPAADTDDDGFQLMDAFVAVASVAALVLGFTLVQVDTALRATEDNIAHEAAAINNLDRALQRYDDTRLAAVHGQLRDYASDIASDEWPKLADGRHSAKADELFETVSGELRVLEPVTAHQSAIYNEVVKTLDTMEDLREIRLEAAQVGLPSLFWKSVAAIFIVLLLIAAFLPPTRKHLAALAGITGALGVLLALVVIMDAPFAGGDAVSADEFRTVAAVLAKRG